MKPITSRRALLKNTSLAATGAVLTSAMTGQVFAAESNTIKIALVGCGGRGTGAAINALSTSGPTQLVAMADVFPDRLQRSLKSLSDKFPKQVNVPVERQFIGLDGYRQAIDCLDGSDVVLLTTPPAFRPMHLEYAVAKGRNVFMEKSFGVDVPGVRRVMAAGEVAKQKNLKVASGLMSRHSAPLEAAIEQVHNGAIGDVITLWAYREHGPVGYHPRGPQESELAHQVRNYSCFTWLNGSFLLDWLIHNIDVCCWVKNAWPVSVQGQGGRQARIENDQLFDHYSVEYSFADGTRLMAQGRHMTNCWNFFGNVIHGTKGCAVLGEGIEKPRLYKGHLPTAENQIWDYKQKYASAYQIEHDLFFDAIRSNKPYNEADRSARSCLTAIMGRMAAESGQQITWEKAMLSNTELAPGLDNLKWDGAAPVQPDSQGRYPVAIPGRTQV